VRVAVAAADAARPAGRPTVRAAGGRARPAGGAASVAGVHCAAAGTRAHRPARQQRGRFALRG